MRHGLRGVLAVVGLLWGILGGTAGAAELPGEVAAACLRALPEELAEGVGAGATSGSGSAGEWRIESLEMNGDDAAEAFLVMLPAKGSREVRFFALRGDEVVSEKVKLEGGALAAVGIRAEPFAEGRALAFVDGGESGQALLFWDGKKLSTVWSAGQPRSGERHWCDVEDLDGDGVGEVVAFFRRELDVFYAEEAVDETSGGASGDASTEVDAVAVFHLQDGKWKKDAALLEGLR